MSIKITAIIYSRLNSRRLFKKGLLKVGNKYLIEHVIDRVKKILNVDQIILATTQSKIDSKLAEISKKKKIIIFKGSEQNVLKRTYDCIKKHKINLFLRVCGDRIFFDNQFIDKISKKIKNNSKMFSNYHLISNNLGRNKIDEGLTLEFISKNCIKKIISNKKINTFNKEHITSYIYENPKKFNIKKIISPDYHFKKIKYTIDEKNDLIKANKILRKLNKNDLYNFRKIYLKAKNI